MKVSVHTMFGKIYEGEAKEVILPGVEEEFSLWDFSESGIYSLRRGRVKIVPSSLNNDSKKNEFKLSIKKGITSVSPMKVCIMVEL